MKPELVVMAAGMGSRFGGLKQLEVVGPGGATVMDYSLYDARRAGVERVVFVIRKELEAAFRQGVGAKYERALTVDYAFQEPQPLPAGFRVPEGRSKPWGTAHAVLAARSQVRAPFLVINADDFYGATAFSRLAHWLAETPESPVPNHAMVAFRMANTLSEHGQVARGVCQVSAKGMLEGVQEHTGLERDGEGASTLGADGRRLAFGGDTPVSMNFWGFRPSLFQALETQFTAFLEAHAEEPGAEFYLPSVVDSLLHDQAASVEVLHTPDRWFGVTYREDKARVVARIQALVDAGVYPASLWS